MSDVFLTKKKRKNRMGANEKDKKWKRGHVKCGSVCNGKVMKMTDNMTKLRKSY